MNSTETNLPLTDGGTNAETVNEPMSENIIAPTLNDCDPSNGFKKRGIALATAIIQLLE